MHPHLYPSLHRRHLAADHCSRLRPPLARQLGTPLWASHPLAVPLPAVLPYLLRQSVLPLPCQPHPHDQHRLTRHL